MHICCTYSRGSHQGVGGTFQNCFPILICRSFVSLYYLIDGVDICQFFLAASRLLDEALIFFLILFKIIFDQTIVHL
jgi:hypothetical protein